jgi:hypothetical protein
VPFSALPPASYGGSVRAEQRLTLSRAGGATTLQAFVDVAPGRITLVGASALGARVLSVVHDGTALREDGATDAASAEQALRDLQLVGWPLAALQRATAGSAWRIEEPRPGTRQVWHGDEAYAEIHYAGASAWDGRSWLVNFAHRYTLDIESHTVH